MEAENKTNQFSYSYGGQKCKISLTWAQITVSAELCSFQRLQGELVSLLFQPLDVAYAPWLVGPQHTRLLPLSHLQLWC